MSDYRCNLFPLEGERHAISVSNSRMIVSCEDYREDYGYVDPAAQAEWDACADQSIDDLKDIARCAIDTMPDVACSAIAAALGLKLHVVIGLSNGRHNKTKQQRMSRNIELAEVTYTELVENYRYQNQ